MTLTLNLEKYNFLSVLLSFSRLFCIVHLLLVHSCVFLSAINFQCIVDVDYFCRKLFKLIKNIWSNSEIPDFSPFRDSYDKYIHKRPDDSKFLWHRSKRFNLASSNSPVQGLSNSFHFSILLPNRIEKNCVLSSVNHIGNLSIGITTTSTSSLSETNSYPSTFHSTPERRKFTKDEWEKFTQQSTKKAVNELVSSPDFSKWVAVNADRITVTPGKSPATNSSQRRQSLLWF